ncbi:MAG: Rha family transcriptional regulator [Fusobacterium sp.]|uniref:Rha family transcriptional regulator n=1 Tax=Fusobacterium sp. TaxID=68766 RepID=UPI00399ACCBA
MNELLKLNLEYDGQIGYYVTSRMLAEGLGKEHRNVLRDLEKIIKGLLKCEHTPQNLIIPSTYINEQNKQEYKQYKLTKDGFTLYMFNVQGFVDFKMAYIQKFNEMERALVRTQKSIETIRMESSNDFALKRIEDRKIQADMLEAQKKYIEKELVKIYKDIKDTADLKIRILENKTFDWEIKENTYDVSKEPMPKLFK